MSESLCKKGAFCINFVLFLFSLVGGPPHFKGLRAGKKNMFVKSISVILDVSVPSE